MGESKTYVSRDQGVQGKGTSLPFIVGIEHNADILDGDRNCERPDDQGDSTENVLVAWLAAEGGGVDI